MSAILLDIPNKPLAEYSEDDHHVLRGPSVEHYLQQIRRALALSAVLQRGVAYAGDSSGDEAIEIDAAWAMSELCRAAWACAQALSEALPGETQNLVVVLDEAIGGA